MGLHITLIRIVNQRTDDLRFLPEDENPELENQFGHLKTSRTADFGQGLETIPGYYYDELGCQLKGVKREFYKRYRPDEFIFAKKKLDELTTYVDKEHLNTFKSELVDKFKEGNTIVWMGY